MRYLLITSLLVFGSASQERDTIVDSARRHGGKATVDIDILAPVGTLNRLVEESTLVVRGVVHSVTTSLSHDEMIVVTEFEIAPLRFYKGALPVSKKRLLRRICGSLPQRTERLGRVVLLNKRQR